MKTIGSGKLLALIVALAMIVSVVPAFTAAAEDVQTVDINGHRYRVIGEVKMPDDAGFEGDRSTWSSYFTWNKAISPLDEGIQVVTDNVHSGSQALLVPGNGGTNSVNGSFVGMFYFNEDHSPVTEEKIYAFTFWRYASGGRMTISVGASADPYSQTVDYDADFAAQYGSWGNDGGQGSNVTNLSSGRWAREGVLFKTTAGVSTMAKVFARYCGGNYFDDFAIYEIDPEPIQPDATATVRLIREDAEPEILGTVENLYAGDTLALPSSYDYEGTVEPDFEEGIVYSYTNPEPIVLQEGDENYLDITYGPYKQIVGENLFTDGGFDSGSLEGWYTGEGTPLAEAAETTAYLEDGALHTISSGKNYGTDGSFETKWAIPTPGATYLIGVDAMATAGSTMEGYGHQYAWFLTWGNPDNEADEEGNPVSVQTSVIADYMDGSTAGQLGSDGSRLHPLVDGEYVTRAFAYTTAETDTDFGFRSAWLRDCAVVYDNFFLYELDDIAADPNAVRYKIVYTTDGTENGDVIATSSTQSGVAGETVDVAEGTLQAVRSGNVFYTNAAAKLTLEAGVEAYYVPVKVLATITGAVAKSVKTVGDYAPILPSEAKLVTDNEEFNADFDETVQVADWQLDGGKAVGKVVDSDLTATVEIETLAADYTLIDNGSLASQNNYSKGQAGYVIFPAPVEGPFAIEMTLKFNQFGNQFLFLNNSGNNGFFGPDQVAIGLNGNFSPVNGNGSGGKISENSLMTLSLDKTYALFIEVDAENNSYSAVISDGENSARAEDFGFRTNGVIDALVAIGNTNDNSPDNAVEISNIQVYAPGVEVPAAAEVTAELGYVTQDGADKLAIIYTVSGAYAGQYLTITAGDSVPEDNHLSTPTVVYDEELAEGKNVFALVPGSPNMTYTAVVSDAYTGYALSKAAAALYPMVAEDIAANLTAYAAEGAELTRIDEAVAALSAGGAVYGADGKFGDARDSFIGVEITDESTVITLNEGLFRNGFGFKVKTKAGTGDSLKDAVSDQLFYQITIKGDEVTLASADAAVTFSLDSVEIEFVSSAAAETAADGVEAEAVSVPEL